MIAQGALMGFATADLMATNPILFFVFLVVNPLLTVAYHEARMREY